MPPVFYEKCVTLLDTTVVIATPLATVWATPYYVNLPPLCAGDLVRFSAEQEVECTVAYNTELVSQVIVSPGWCANNVDGMPGGAMPCEIIGNDATNNPIHYWVIERNAEWLVPADMPVACVQFRLRSRSTAASGNDKAIIKPGQGHLSVSVWR